MPTTLLLLMLLIVLLLAGVCFALWRYWERQASISAEEEAYDRRVASLNQRQANRLSDDLLRQPVTQEDAWALMVQRGKRASERRDRYGGDLQRRAQQKKK